jgi:hypothetical protein
VDVPVRAGAGVVEPQLHGVEGSGPAGAFSVIRDAREYLGSADPADCSDTVWRWMSTEELIYAAAVRSVERQEQALDEIRSRVGVLLGAASVVVSFLGTRSVVSGHPIGAAGKVGGAAFVGVAVIAALTLAPWPGWSFGFDPWKLHRAQVRAPRSVEAASMAMTIGLGKARKANANKLRWFYRGLVFGILLLGVEVVAWLIEVRG